MATIAERVRIGRVQPGNIGLSAPCTQTPIASSAQISLEVSKPTFIALWL